MDNILEIYIFWRLKLALIHMKEWLKASKKGKFIPTQIFALPNAYITQPSHLFSLFSAPNANSPPTSSSLCLYLSQILKNFQAHALADASSPHARHLLTYRSSRRVYRRVDDDARPQLIASVKLRAVYDLASYQMRWCNKSVRARAPFALLSVCVICTSRSTF